MKQLFKKYVIIWAVLLVLFNVIAFVSPGWIEHDKYTPPFWIGYVAIMLAFGGQLVCSYFAFQASDLKKAFYNMSLITISYTGLILSFVIGGLCMFHSMLPGWVAAILCAILLAFTAIAVVKASVAIEVVSDIDEKIKVKTFFIRSLTTDADSLVARAKSPVAKAECKKVYEAVRYSDPMSHEALASVESEIAVRFAKFSEAVAADEAAQIAELAAELLILIGDRNKKCKLLK